VERRLCPRLGREGLSDAAATLRFVAMGTRIECHLFGAESGERVASALRDAIEAVDDALTIHRASPATLLNERLRNGTPAPVDDPILWDALVACDGYWRATGGLFDVSAGMASADWDTVTLDANTVRATHQIAFDFGGIGKGIALDACRAILVAERVPSALVSLGESSILLHGPHPLGGDWPLSVPHPQAPSEELLALALADRCVSISSSIGSAATETIRPETGAAITGPRTAVAVDISGAASEALSTALLIAYAGERELVTAQAGGAAGYVFDFDNAAELAAGVTSDA
jgi:FAD:protein FMN transferase